MKFIRFLKFDINNGILKRYKTYIGFSIFIIIVFFDCQATARSFNTNFTLGEYFMYLYGGIKHYIPTPGEPFKMPYLWLLNHMLILYFTLKYAPSDLNGFGQQTIYRSGGRITWWISKCVWQILSIGGYYIVSWITMLVMTLVSKDVLSLNITPSVLLFADFGNNILPFTSINLGIELLALPLIFTVSLGLLQLTLSITFKPTYAYIISAALCIMASHTQNPLLFGNYAMAIRNSKVISNGMSTPIGFISMLILSLICIVMGAVRFSKYDILNREE